MKLRDTTFDVDFYWKGDRYRQVIRPKIMPRKCSVVCRMLSEPFGDWVNMPSGREVKPVIRLNKENKAREKGKKSMYFN